jgi:hypothetical protein
MLHKTFPILILFIFIFGVIQSNAQVFDDDDDDDDDFFASTAVFTQPSALDPNTEYQFKIVVTNAAALSSEKGDWINQFDLTMPSSNYEVEEETLTAPHPLHGATGDQTEIDRWEVSFDPNTVTITWQALAVVSSRNWGDIREGESLEFEFIAETDSNPSDGFDWVAFSDEGNMLSGTAYIAPWTDDDDDNDDNDASPPDDDDDTWFTNDDDDDDDAESGDDDDDDSGCGC